MQLLSMTAHPRLLTLVQHWMAPPVVDGDEDKTRQANLINVICLNCIAFTLAVVLGDLLGGATRSSTLTIDLLACALTWLLLYWLRSGRLDLARIGLVVFGLIYITGVTASLGSIRTPSGAIFLFWVLMTGLIFDLKGIIFGMLAASLAVWGLILAENAAWLPPPSQLVGVTQWVTFTALFAFASGLSYYINQSSKSALALAEQEVRQRQQAEAALEATNNRLQGMLDALPDLLFEAGRDGRIHEFHSPRTDLLAVAPEVFLGKTFTEVLPVEAAYSVNAALRQAARSGFATSGSYCLDLPQGTCWFELSVAVKPGHDAQDQRFICVARDITRRHQAEAALSSSEQRHQLLADNARDVTWTMSPAGKMLSMSASVQALRGVTQAQALQQTLAERLAPASLVIWQAYFDQLHADCAAGEPPESFRGELEYRLPDGGSVWTEVMAHPLFSDKGLVEIVGVTRDIAEHKRLVRELEQARDAMEAAKQALESANVDLARIATTDPLTGVWNRRHFVQVAEAERAKACRYQVPLSMLLFDIDHFKRINDNFGHPSGDQVLIALSRRVGAALRQSDVLARWGGEEFVVIMPHSDASGALQLAEKLRALVATEPFADVGQVTVSFGVAEFQSEESLADWFKRVDLALYAAKSDGRNTVRLAA